MMMRQIKAGLLEVRQYATRDEMGAAVAGDVTRAIGEVLGRKAECNVIFAAAPSQNELLRELAADSGVAWDRVNAFHMDEYIGLAADAPQGFGNFLRDRLFGKLPFKSVYYLDGGAEPARECERYTELLKAHKADIVCAGIGENCHLAFNDPPANFEDKLLVKVVDLDETCRMQQVNDGCFASLDLVPKQALTLTVPVLTDVRYIFATVPSPTKARAVYNTVHQPVSGQYPSTILKNHPNAKLYIDLDSGSLLN